MSLSAWRAWVEIAFPTFFDTSLVVALRMESVGRNYCLNRKQCITHVALRMESVGRNGVIEIIKVTADASLSAWRAWVEISILT